MVKQKSIKKDENQLAYDIINQLGNSEKNPAAVVLGRLGGLKGGKARAKKLSPHRRKLIAKKAAESRWHKK
ncbi:MAG: hypothetical protein WDL87_01245 [Candidatus Omnitrophota bacterium]|jgi:hypothetical protein